jgi:hypothetical protein
MMRRAFMTLLACKAKGEAVSARMASASAQEEIDEPPGKFLRARNEIGYLELLA